MSISSLESLAVGWKIAKDEEDAAKARRLEIEESILAACGGETKFFDLRVAYKENRTWDQGGLSVLAQKIKPEAFPFRVKYDEKLSESKVLAKIDPAFWAENFSPLLTIKPAKPSFTWKGTKDD